MREMECEKVGLDCKMSGSLESLEAARATLAASIYSRPLETTTWSLDWLAESPLSNLL